MTIESRSHIRWIVRAAFVLAATLPCRAIAQGSRDTVRIPEGVACGACRIVVTAGPTLGDSDGDGVLIRHASRGFRDSKGRILLTMSPGPGGLPYFFDSTGKFISRIGSYGSGPGEFGMVASMQGMSADSVAIFDIELLRRTILAPGGKPVRSAPMPIMSVLALQMSNGSQVVSSLSAGRDKANSPFHAFDANGQHLRSFGDQPGLVAGRTTPLVPMLSHSIGDRFWAYNSQVYALQQWNISGLHIRTLIRFSPLFSFEKAVYAVSGAEPTPTLHAVHEDRDGLLWTLIRVSSADWKSWLGTPEVVRGRTVYRASRNDKLYDTIIEVIDPARGVVLQSQRVSGAYDFFLSDRTVGVQKETDEGFLKVQIQYLSLTGHRR